MSIPSWATSMVRNYRQFFKEKYGRETTLTDEDIYDITETYFDDTDNRLQDEYRVEMMFETEKGK